MKPCHDNDDAAIYAGRAVLCFNGYVSIGQLLQHISFIYCGLCTVKSKNANKNIKKKFCQAT